MGVAEPADHGRSSAVSTMASATAPPAAPRSGSRTAGRSSRDLGALRRAHASEAAYMAFDPDALNFADWSPELSREVRGLRLWLPLRMHGIAAFRAHLEEKLALADLAFELIGQLPGVWLLPREPLSIVAFGLADDNRARRVLSRLNRRGNTHLSGTTVAGRFVIRLAVLSFRTHEAELRSVIRELAELLVAEP